MTDGLMGVTLTSADGVLTPGAGVGEFVSVLGSGGTFCVWGVFVEGVGLLVTVVAVTIPRSAPVVVAEGGKEGERVWTQEMQVYMVHVLSTHMYSVGGHIVHTVSLLYACMCMRVIKK